MINEGLSEIIGPCPVPSPRDLRERNDDPGQKRRGHRNCIEDMHQPYHVGDIHDRGGNDTQVRFFDK